MTNQSNPARSQSRLGDLVSVILGVLVSVFASMNTINNTDGLVLVVVIMVASVVGTILSAMIMAILGSGTLHRCATRALYFCVSAGFVIFAAAFTRQF